MEKFKKALKLRDISLHSPQPFSQTKNLDCSKLKDFAADDLNLMKMIESSLKIWKTLWEKEIARYEQFLLFPQWFLQTCTADT